MRQPSIVIHKGKKEEKYDLYVEDYVISFIKEKKGMQDAAEILFYGCREENGRKYTIYGAGQDRHITVFDKYDLLEEISCTMKQAEPVFVIREANGSYEVKGYHLFYYDNAEMQDYLIHHDRQENRKSFNRGIPVSSGQAAPSHGPAVTGSRRKASPHYVVSLQMGLVFLVLVAIVINSANSYDKLEQLNQSAAEVFFVMENQEAEKPGDADVAKEEKPNDILVERDESAGKASASDDLLQDSVLRENAGQEKPDEQKELTEKDRQESSTEEDREVEKESEADETRQRLEAEEEPADEQAQTQAAQQEEEDEREEAQEATEKEEGVEALSRNVSSYYEVERGDTLYRISQKIYGDTSHVKKICEANQITDPDNIHYGQKIILP